VSIRSTGRPVLGIAARLAGRGVALKVGLAIAGLGLCLLFVVGLFVASAPGSSGGGEECSLGGAPGKSIPADYLPWLPKATARYRLGPRGLSIIAAVHSIESDFGRSDQPGVHSGTNSAGAAGPGQFLLETWSAYGVDADGDGARDVYSVPDSVFATANYLHASGAPRDWAGAIFAYNHAEWYVQEVLEKADSLGGSVVCQPAAELGEPPSGRLARVLYYARWIESRHLHYCWGGGHAPRPGPSTGAYCWSAAGSQVFGAPEAGLDCSGAVRWLLVLAGYPDPGALVSNELGAHYPSGPGARFTIWANVDHVFVTIDGRDWGTSESNFAHGPGFADHSHAGFLPSHPAGL
jgi:hypothetical protein